MTDLPDRILAAIALVAQNAEELKAVQPTLMRIGLSTSDGRSLVVSSDPSADLRRCEADKRTVERHAPHILTNSARKPQPIICSYCSHVPDAVEWPCPDLFDRAAAYDIEAS